MPVSTWESSQMNMKMFRRYAMRAGVVALCSAALCAVPMPEVARRRLVRRRRGLRRGWVDGAGKIITIGVRLLPR